MAEPPGFSSLYSVLLGDDTQRNMAPLPSGVFSNPDVRLRVWFNDGVHGLQLLSPDQRIAAVGYAMMSETVPDGAISNAKIATGAVDSTQIATGAVGSTQLASNLSISGAFTAGSFQGSGAGLTQIPASAVVTAPPGMVLIPAGAFTMGDSLDGMSNAAPVTVNLSAYYIATHEVTISKWQAVYLWAISHGYSFTNPGEGKAAENNRRQRNEGIVADDGEC